jgi:ubiquinone/menaquinone biosynthesis C-methylase UbiE
MAVISNSLTQSHEFVTKFVKPGDIVIDATAGKGNDTVFLSALVGEEGKVYTFDIQEIAIAETKKKLQEKGFVDRVVFINDGHENMDLYVNNDIKCIMYNLGYLPGGDHNISTKAETTIEAIKKSQRIILKGGLISIVIYYGGDSGFDEKEKVLDFVKEIDNNSFTVMKTEFINQINCPPILVLIEKLK